MIFFAETSRRDRLFVARSSCREKVDAAIRRLAKQINEDLWLLFLLPGESLKQFVGQFDHLRIGDSKVEYRHTGALKQFTSAVVADQLSRKNETHSDPEHNQPEPFMVLRGALTRKLQVNSDVEQYQLAFCCPACGREHTHGWYLADSPQALRQRASHCHTYWDYRGEHKTELLASPYYVGLIQIPEVHCVELEFPKC